LLNTSNNAPYSAIDEWMDKGGGTLEFGHHPTCHYEDRDGYTGDRSVIDDVIHGMNDALNLPAGNYGSLRKVGSGGNFGVGFGDAHGDAGYHSATWAGVDNKKIPSYSGQLAIMNAEVFEILTRTDDLQGNTTGLITNPDGSLNPVGRDLLAYCFIKE
jgi:hypothetical protein